MGLLTRVRAANAAGSDPAEGRAVKWGSTPPRDPAIAAWLGEGGESVSGQQVSVNSAMQLSAFYAGRRILAETCGFLPLHVMTRSGNGKERAPQHRLYHLLHNKPNPWQTAFRFKRMLTGHVVSRGNGYAQIVASGGAAAEALVPLHPDRTRSFWGPDGLPAYAYTPQNGPERVLLHHEVLHLRGLEDDGLMGLNPIEAQREMLGRSLAAQEYGARFFRNDARPSGVIKHPAHFEDDAAWQKWRKAWQDAQSGINRGKTAVLEDGMEYQDIGLSNEDAQFLETMQFSVLDIARMLRIPGFLLEAGDKSATYASVEQFFIAFRTLTITPWAAVWTGDLKLSLFTDAEWLSHDIVMDLKALMQGDAKARGEIYKVLFQNAGLSPNAMLRAEDMNTLGPLGDRTFVPMNMVPLDLVDEVLKQRNAGAPPASEETPDDDQPQA